MSYFSQGLKASILVLTGLLWDMELVKARLHQVNCQNTTIGFLVIAEGYMGFVN